MYDDATLFLGGLNPQEFLGKQAMANGSTRDKARPPKSLKLVAINPVESPGESQYAAQDVRS